MQDALRGQRRRQATGAWSGARAASSLCALSAHASTSNEGEFAHRCRVGARLLRLTHVWEFGVTLWVRRARDLRTGAAGAAAGGDRRVQNMRIIT